MADASLVVAADALGIPKVFTFDHRDFSAYRFRNTQPFKITPPKK